MLQSLEATLSDPWKKWFGKFVINKTMNNCMHKSTLDKFVSNIERKAKEIYMKRVALVKLFTELRQAGRG